MGGGASKNKTAPAPAQAELRAACDEAIALAAKKGQLTRKAVAEELLAQDTSSIGNLRRPDFVSSAELLPPTTDATFLFGQKFDGLRFSSFLTFVDPLTAEGVARAKAGATEKKKVLMVIDVQDGYDGGFISSLPEEAPGGLAYLRAPHDVRASHELVSRKLIKKIGAGEVRISYDKVCTAAAFEPDSRPRCRGTTDAPPDSPRVRRTGVEPRPGRCKLPKGDESDHLRAAAKGRVRTDCLHL